jgi:hypothetical protein
MHVAASGRTGVGTPFLAPAAGTVTEAFFYCAAFDGPSSAPDTWTAVLAVQRSGSATVADVASVALDPNSPPLAQSPLTIPLPGGGIALGPGDNLWGFVDPGDGSPVAIYGPTFLAFWSPS